MTATLACDVAIVGGGPAGLMAADRLLKAGRSVHLFDAMPSLGRKFLLAGRGGLNLTHSEPLDRFKTRYRAAAPIVGAWVEDFTPGDLRVFAADLGIETFIGTSGRVFPKEFKAAPLLRAWLANLRARGLQIHVRHRWTGGSLPNTVSFETPDGPLQVTAKALLLALGGASWPSLGSDGCWTAPLAAIGIPSTALQPANCGFEADWSPHLKGFAGTPFKNVALRVGEEEARGEMILTETGIEGGLVYALSGAIRDRIVTQGICTAYLDLKPDLTPENLAAKLTAPRGSASYSTFLKKALRLSPAAIALAREAGPLPTDPVSLAGWLKALPLPLHRPRPIAEAISTAGGVQLDALTPDLMAKARPGVFLAGEMLDWEAPTGGYLLQACFASGVRAARGIEGFLTPAV
ncbi:TIGR03862 family flavoprotein [Lacibacterium aquatile]|uniref:TIGR03862 family flavoprotein n=1 Tax=Lacibacterium aquatile TaxID=1168082 RepID=A0ABW5DRI4_9PROT